MFLLGDVFGARNGPPGGPRVPVDLLSDPRWSSDRLGIDVDFKIVFIVLNAIQPPTGPIYAHPDLHKLWFSKTVFNDFYFFIFGHHGLEMRPQEPQRLLNKSPLGPIHGLNVYP